MRDFWLSMGIIVLYFIVFGAVLSIILKMLIKSEKEIVRKYQHIMFAASVLLYLRLFNQAYHAMIAAGIFLCVAYGFIFMFEKTSYYKTMIVDRKKRGGEVKQSVLYAQIMFILLFLIFWLILDHTKIIIIAVASWGIGDALAAIVGKKYGTHTIDIEGVDPNKTVEGSLALSIGVGFIIYLILVFYGGYPLLIALVMAIVLGIVSSIVEAYSKKGLDTLFMPLTSAFSMYFLILLFEGLGVL